MSLRRNTTTPRGFTLLEALIAAGLMAIMGAALATSLSRTVDTKEAVEAISGRYHVVRQAMSRMADEISMAYISLHRVNSELRVDTQFKGERDVLHFTAYGHVPRIADVKESDQRELSFFVGQDERTGETSILRRVDTSIDDEMDEGGREQTLLPGVTDLEFQYWDSTTEDWKDEWDTEESAYAGRLPNRVKITFTAEMDDGIEQTFTTQTKVWLIKPWAFRN